MGLRLSKSQLDKYIACPRCFWLAKNHKIDQPDMISSKVWKGVERVTQGHYEVHRQAKTTPPNLIVQVPEGAIPYQGDRISVKDLRYWGKDLAFKVDDVEVTTALDDMLQRDHDTAEGVRTLYNVIDYKSKSKPTDEESTRDLYQNQADVFDLACNVNGYTTNGKVYFDYWYPISVAGGVAPDGEYGAGVGITKQIWGSQVIVLQADHARIKQLILAAAACLEGPLPDPNITRSVIGRGANKGQEKIEGCPVCVYVHQREAFFAVKVAA